MDVEAALIRAPPGAAPAARLCPKLCGQDTKRWEDWIFMFVQKHQLQAIIPFVPTVSPTLGHLVYDMILAHFLAHDRQVGDMLMLRHEGFC